MYLLACFFYQSLSYLERIHLLYTIATDIVFFFADDTSLLERVADPGLTFENINRDLTKLHN